MALPLRSVTGLLVIALWAAGVAGCTSEPPKRSLFRFDTIKDRDPALVAG